MTIETLPPAGGTSLKTVVICTALDVEYKAVRAHLKNTVTKQELGTLYEIGAFPADHPQWRVVLTRTGPGNTPAGVQVERAIRLYQPQVVLFVGVAGGCKDVTLGDVVIPDIVYDFQHGKEDESGFVPRIRTLAPSYGLLELAARIAIDETWQRRILHATPRTDADAAPDARSAGSQDEARALVKPIAAGSVVVAARSARTAQLLAHYCSDAVAVEMEGHGFLLGAYVNAGVDALVVRGISDLLSDKTQAADRRWQPTASRNAAAFAFELLAQQLPIPATTPPTPKDETDDGLQPFDENPSDKPAPAPWARVGALPTLVDRFQHRDVAQSLDQVANAVLSGGGGVGKTQLAVQFAARQWRDTHVRLGIWISARSRDAILTGYTQAAVDLLGANPTNPDQAAAQLLAWLADTDQRWLIVLDDLHDPEDLGGLWPPANREGRSVVTTRRCDPSLASTDHVLLDVGEFTRAESLGYLAAKLVDHPRLRQGGEDLVAAVGFLPLALAQAVAYLADRGMTCQQYQDQLANQLRTLPKRCTLPKRDSRDDHVSTVSATVALSISLADTLTSRLARPVMVLASILDPDGVPLVVFTTERVLDFLADVVGRVVEPQHVREALNVAHRLMLVSLDEQTALPVVRVHSPVRHAVREIVAKQSPAEIVLGVFAAADALLSRWPDVERDTVLAEVLRANANVLHGENEGTMWLLLSRVHPVLVRVGRSLGLAGLVANARDYFQHLLAKAEKRLGSDHHDTLIVRGELAHWRGQAGDLAGAVNETEKLVDDCVRVLGADHYETLATRGNMIAMRGQEDPAFAISEGEQLLEDYVRVLGPDHPNTFIQRAHVARWRGQTGDLAGAIRQYEQLVQDCTRVLDPDHPQTLITRGDLADWQGQAGDAARAAQVYEQLLGDCRRVFGPNHHHTRDANRNLDYWRARRRRGPDGGEQVRG